MIVPKSAIVFFTAQIFFSFLAMCCFAGVASFQAKWGVGPCQSCSICLSTRRCLKLSRSRPVWICDIRLGLRDIPICLPASRSCHLRKIRQVCSASAYPEGGPCQLHPHGDGHGLLLAHRVC